MFPTFVRDEPSSRFPRKVIRGGYGLELDVFVSFCCITRIPNVSSVDGCPLWPGQARLISAGLSLDCNQLSVDMWLEAPG